MARLAFVLLLVLAGCALPPLSRTEAARRVLAQSGGVAGLIKASARSRYAFPLFATTQANRADAVDQAIAENQPLLRRTEEKLADRIADTYSEGEFIAILAFMESDHGKAAIAKTEDGILGVLGGKGASEPLTPEERRARDDFLGSAAGKSIAAKTAHLLPAILGQLLPVELQVMAEANMLYCRNGLCGRSGSDNQDQGRQ